MKKHLRDMALLICASALALCLTVREGPPRQRLTTLDNEDLYTVLVRCGFVFPERMSEADRARIIPSNQLRKMLITLEENPRSVGGYSNTVIVDTYRSLAKASCAYYGVEMSEELRNLLFWRQNH